MKESMRFAKMPDNQPPSVEVFNIGEKTSYFADTFKRLGEIQELIKEDGLDKYKSELKNLHDNENSYFVRKKIEQIIKLPLDDLDMESKRIFLNNNWEDMRYAMSKCAVVDKISGELVNLQKIEKLNPLTPDDMSDFNIERYFSLYRKLAPYKYNVYEANRYEHFYNDKNIIDNYRMPETRLTNAYPFYFSRLNSKHCALYHSGECGAAKFYKLDEAAEKSIKEGESTEGSILSPDLEDIIISIEEAARKKDSAYLKEYIYFRRNLPQTLRNELDRSLQVQLPPEMDKEFCDDDEFKIYLHKHSDKIKISNNEKDLDVLLHSLRALLEQKYKTSAEKNQGFKIDNIGVLKNIAQSYYNILEGQYYRFEDYLRHKRFLPEDLVGEFEKKFAIDFQKYSADEFPYYNNSFFRDIKKKKPAIREHFHWLGNEIMKRVEEVNAVRTELKEVKFEEILKEEGFNQENLSSAEMDIIVANYKVLMELQIRKNIEDEFGIRLTEFSFREQVQFVNFLSAKTDEQIKKVKEFLNQGQSDAAKAQRVKSFLSLESGVEMGDRILSIGGNLQDRPELADKLFAEYAIIVDGANQEAEEISRMYGEIFFQRGVDKDKVVRAISRKAGSLLCEAGEALKNCDSDKRENLVEDLINHLKREDKTQNRILRQLKEIAEKLNSIYNNINNTWESIIYNEQKEHLRYDLQGDPDYTDEEVEDELEEFDYYNTPDSHGKYDSSSIQELIGILQGFYKEFFNEKIWPMEIRAKNWNVSIEEAKRISEEKRKTEEEKYSPFVKRLEEYLAFQKNFEQKFDNFVYGYETASLPENFQNDVKAGILNYQPEMEGGGGRPYLPVGVSSSLPKKNEAYLKPIDSLVYLFWLSNQKQGGELMVVDTMQKTNYQAKYGLSEGEAYDKAEINGQRDEKWYKAAIEAHGLEERILMADYSRLENDSETEKYLALLDKLDDKKRCAPIARALNSLVEESRRRDVYDQGGADREEREKKNALLKKYGKAEIAFILSKRQIKIGHEKELRYDIIARVMAIYEQLANHRGEYEAALKKIFVVGRKAQNRIKQYLEPQGMIDLCLYMAYYKDFSDPAGELFDEAFETDRKTAKFKQALQKESDREKRSEIQNQFKQATVEASSLKGRLSEMLAVYTKQKEGADYFVTVHREAMDKLKLTNSKLSKIMRDNRHLGREILEQSWFNDKLPEFFYPKTITGYSFEMKKEGKDEFSDFREPYSTYKGASTEEIPIEANQVIASTSPMAAAKLLVLSAEKQKEYYEKVLKPLLVNYYIATSPNREEATEKFSRDAEEVKTISDVIRLVQDKVIRPVEEKIAA